MTVTQYEKAARFRAFHDGPSAFVIPNPWDVGSARLLAGLGFQALATTSAASASALGRKDGELTRDEALAHARLIVNATDLPVSADLEKGFGDAPEVVAETIPLAAVVGRWMYDRGRDSQPRPSTLRFWLGRRTHCGSGTGGTCIAVSLCPEGAGAQSAPRVGIRIMTPRNSYENSAG
jgi:Phosphoenolpyruvate phosphomutase